MSRASVEEAPRGRDMQVARSPLDFRALGDDAKEVIRHRLIFNEGRGSGPGRVPHEKMAWLRGELKGGCNHSSQWHSLKSLWLLPVFSGAVFLAVGETRDPQGRLGPTLFCT